MAADLGPSSRNVLVSTDDLFFTVKIEATARKCDVALTVVTDLEQFVQQLERLQPQLIVLDLTSDSCRPFECIGKAKQAPDLLNIPIVGFYPHVQEDLQKAALDAGCDRVIPRSKFSRDLAAILRGEDH